MLTRLLSIGWLIAASSAGFANTDVETTITEVVVYSSGASVTRTAEVEVRSGINELTFTGLVPDIGPNDFQLSVDSSNVNIGQIRLVELQREQALDSQARRLEDEIFGVHTELSAIDDRTKTAQLQLRFLDGIASGYAKESWAQAAAGNNNVDTWQSALAVLDEGATQARDRIRNATVEQRDLAARLSKLERDLQSVRGRTRATKVIRASLAVTQATTVTLRLTYFLDDAEWQPIYQARLDSETGHLLLAQQAEISQATDEDWQGVAMTLSTSQPSGELARPELAPEFVAIRPEQSKVSMFSTATSASLRVPMQDSIEEVIVTAAQAPKIGNYGVSYPIAGKTTVADKRPDPTIVDLVQFEFDTTLLTQIVPRTSDNAFLVARFKYDQSLPLFASIMKIYVDGDYTGTTEIAAALSGEELSLPMGQDRRVDVRVEDQGGQRRVTGFIGKTKREVADYLFTITNRRSSPTQVEVFDQFPVAVDKTIDVTRPNTATAPTEEDLDDKPGLAVWRKELASGESWQIQHQYEVSYPADKSLSRRY